MFRWMFCSVSLSHSSRLLNYLIFHFIVYIENPLISSPTMHSLHTDGPPCTSRTLREMESWLPIISFSNGTEEFYFIKLKQFSQKWKMNFGKSDALNSGGLFLIVLFSQKETLSKEIQNCTSEAEILYFLLLCFFYFRGREKEGKFCLFWMKSAF